VDPNQISYTFHSHAAMPLSLLGATFSYHGFILPCATASMMMFSLTYIIFVVEEQVENTLELSKECASLLHHFR
jgi:hypothetical protein